MWNQFKLITVSSISIAIYYFNVIRLHPLSGKQILCLHTDEQNYLMSLSITLLFRLVTLDLSVLPSGHRMVGKCTCVKDILH